MFCDECHHDVPPSWNSCPHCGRPGLFPNVRAAGQPAEKKALVRRYHKAKKAAATRDAGPVLQDFEAAMGRSQAVLARPLGEVERLATSDKQGYATYHQLLDAGLLLPDGNGWDLLRTLADDALFTGYKEHIRFAALSLDGVGLSNYGECSISFRDDMIAHRASVFVENSAVFMKRRGVKPDQVEKKTRGHRAIWRDRAMLCVAKLGERVQPATRPDAFGGMLLQQGATGEDDEFVEVHVYGSMTARSFERVILTKRLRSKARLRKLREQLGKLDVELQERA